MLTPSILVTTAEGSRYITDDFQSSASGATATPILCPSSKGGDTFIQHWRYATAESSLGQVRIQTIITTHWYGFFININGYWLPIETAEVEDNEERLPILVPRHPALYDVLSSFEGTDVLGTIIQGVVTQHLSLLLTETVYPLTNPTVKGIGTSERWMSRSWIVSLEMSGITETRAFTVKNRHVPGIAGLYLAPCEVPLTHTLHRDTSLRSKNYGAVELLDLPGDTVVVRGIDRSRYLYAADERVMYNLAALEGGINLTCILRSTTNTVLGSSSAQCDYLLLAGHGILLTAPLTQVMPPLIEVCDVDD